jgi:hypothetical protein
MAPFFFLRSFPFPCLHTRLGMADTGNEDLGAGACSSRSRFLFVLILLSRHLKISFHLGLDETAVET